MRARDRDRDHRSEEDLFRHDGTSDSLPSIDELMRGARRQRVTRRGRSGTRAAADFTIRHPIWFTFRILMYGAMLLLGLGLMVCCPAGAAVHYADADTLAHAPACARGVDLAMSSADCVGTLTMTHDHGVYPDDSDDYAIDLDAPDANEPLDYETAVFPASTEFSDAAGESGTVRAQFWEGRIVALTATSGDRSVYVVTDANPGIPAGTAISFALFGTSLVLLALLLFGVARPVRRWLPTGVFTRLALTGIAIGAVGCFFTGIGLILQPERVLLAGVLGPSITGGVIALFWITLYGQSRRTRRIGLIPSTR